jgi:hypothetical protein
VGAVVPAVDVGLDRAGEVADGAVGAAVAACRWAMENHEDASLVLTTYGHLMPDSENRTRRAVDEAWRALSVPRDEEEAL